MTHNWIRALERTQLGSGRAGVEDGARKAAGAQNTFYARRIDMQIWQKKNYKSVKIHFMVALFQE